MILLVKPEPVHNAFNLDMALKTEPLELEYICTILKEQGIEAYLYEASSDKHSYTELLQELNPEFVAVTGYITQENLMKDYIRSAKQHSEKIVTIAGGPHAQINYSQFFILELDYICRSDNIYAILDVVKHESENGALSDLSLIDGLCYKENGNWVVNDMSPFDINLLPFPDRSHFNEHKNEYRYLDVSPVALLKTSSSCPFNCNFCFGTNLNKGKYYQRDVEKVIEEIKTIDCGNIQIIDDDFLFDKKRIRKFIDLIKKNHIEKTFICYGRADFIVREKELIKELVEIGFQYFMVGLEAINDSVLESYDKKITLDVNETCVNIVQHLKANIVGLFIIDINFKKKDFRNMRKWIKAHKITYTGVSIFTPIPGTKLYEQYKDKLITTDIEKWDFMHLVISPVNMSKFHFYLEYYLLVMEWFRMAQKEKIYSFLKLSDYKSIFLKLLFTEGIKNK